jgi:hypothetical protein
MLAGRGDLTGSDPKGLFCPYLQALPALANMSDDQKLPGLAAIWETISSALYQESTQTATLDERVRNECRELSRLCVTHRVKLDDLVSALSARAAASMNDYRERLLRFSAAAEKTLSPPVQRTVLPSPAPAVLGSVEEEDAMDLDA